jgi:radical SAM-linked protein
MLFLFSKNDSAVFISHLGVIEVFSAAVIRSTIPACYTQGFNPLLKIDFASPAPLGLHCCAEVACIDLEEPLEPRDFTEKINGVLPKGFLIINAEAFIIAEGTKKHSPASLLWGFRYGESIVPFKEEKNFRLAACKEKTLFELTRDGMMAANPQTGKAEDYFDVYRALYPPA